MDIDFHESVNWQQTINKNETVIKIKISENKEIYYKWSIINEYYKRVKNNIVESNYGIIGKVFKNGVIRVLFKIKLVQEDNEIEIRESEEY